MLNEHKFRPHFMTSLPIQLADAVTAAHQQHVTLDEIFFTEDNCYNHGPLISPEMIRTVLHPYYRELLKRVRSRQIDPTRHLYLQIDTDGDCSSLITFITAGAAWNSASSSLAVRI